MKRILFARWTGDAWGGLAAMLVALPSAIAFGVTIYTPLGGAAQGALAGILGATALGLIAPALGGANRLITAPCAPAAAVLSAFAIERLAAGVATETVLVMMTVLGLAAGGLQVAFGAVGLGRLIKYMPYPVVSGYLSGVGLYILASQTPRLLGAPKGAHFWETLADPALWQWRGVAVGVVTMAVMLGAGRFTRAIPAAILGLLAGVLAYFALAAFDPALLTAAGNPLLIGALGDGGAGAFGDALAQRWQGLGGLDLPLLTGLLAPALTLAILLSIDTLKTCVVLDALTRTRHNSNRELMGQGAANLASAVIGGIPGAGTMGATLVNLSSGAQSRWSGVIEGVLALLAFLLLGALLAWIPVAALAGILMVVGARMIDRHSLEFLRARSTVLDFVVIAAVVCVALTVSLIAASGVGVVLAVLLYLRAQMGASIVHRKVYLNQISSKRNRLGEEREILQQHGREAVVFELRGGLFFGTADQLYTALEAELKRRNYLILDMRRVQMLDITAAHMLDLIRDTLAERDAVLIFSQLPRKLATGQDMQRYFDQVGLVRPGLPVRVFEELDAALEWVEDRIIEARFVRVGETALPLQAFELFRGRKEATVAMLEQRLEQRAYRAGERIVAYGEAGDAMFLIRRGAVRLVLPLEDGAERHLSTLGRGAFFGEMAFLDGAPRSADAIAAGDTELFVLSRAVFDAFAEEHKKAALQFMEGLASVLADRLRVTHAELRALAG
ncbi:MAG: SLC26A/SulP transporter family protein [Betaproteobacteria bacterium]|nr:SLC26A/SulP transporter family protein [Betaproteobacteria bacterium]